MTPREVIELYLKERGYENAAFGDYRDAEHLNIASFLTFIEQYVNKAQKEYTGAWKEKPPWLIASKECGGHSQKKCPVGTYEALIKIFALAGAALETFTYIDSEQWRQDGVKEKWKNITGE